MKEQCPISGGDHRYFVFKTFETYEPYHFSFSDKENAETINTINAAPYLYQKVEKAILGCNCGSVISKDIEKA